jgi:DNA processing protein
MDGEKLKFWLALKAVEDVGPVCFRTLLQAFSSPREVFSATRQALRVLPGIGPKIADNIHSFSDWKKIDHELEIAERIGVEIVTCTDSRYPVNLLNIYDYPPFLYVRGSLAPNDIDLPLAIVGARLASVYGRYTTEKLSRELAMRGVTVVSGLARGIDAAAHRGALAGKGKTIAVLGTGIDTIYPPENEKLADQIIRNNGAVISEFSLGTPPNAPNFPSRNRIISGISLGVVVVEAGEKSGSLITARIAAEQGRSVFAVPGEIGSSGSRGTNHLIKQGATLIEGIDDILDEIMPQAGFTRSGINGELPSSPQNNGLRLDMVNLPLLSPKSLPADSGIPGAAVGKTSPLSPENSAALTAEENILLPLLCSSPLAIDTLINQSGLTARAVQNALLTLELSGMIKQLPGKQFLLKE